MESDHDDFDDDSDGAGMMSDDLGLSDRSSDGEGVDDESDGAGDSAGVAAGPSMPAEEGEHAAAVAAATDSAGATGARRHVLERGRQLERALIVSQARLEERAKECRANTRKTQAHIKELNGLIGGVRSAHPHVDPQARRVLIGDHEESQSVSSLRTEVDFFFGCRPPMDSRGQKLQGNVIDHRASSFQKRARETLVTEVLNSVKKALCLNVKQRSGRDPDAGKREVERLATLTSSQLLDEAERANIQLTDPGCKVWDEVGQVMWKTSKKCAAECRLQFLNNDDPRLTAHISPAAGTEHGGRGQAGSSEALRIRVKRPLACEACAARKKKCRCMQPADAAPEHEAAGGWTKQEAKRVLELVKSTCSKVGLPDSSRKLLKVVMSLLQALESRDLALESS